ncbi:hypothetical protein NX10_26040, partial [Pseudomonas fluorescens]
MFAISLRNTLALATLALACSTHASSFDCTSAAGKAETAVCNDPYLSSLDDKLAEQWRTTLGNV